MTFNKGYPETSGSLDSQPIRENFGFLKNTLDTHASGSSAHNADAINIDIIGSPPVDNLKLLYSYILSAGTFCEDVITDAGDGTINVSSGSGFIRISDSHTAPLVSFEWASSSSIAINDDVLTYIYIDYNNGNPVIKTTTDKNDIDDNNDKICIGHVFKVSGSSTIHARTGGLNTCDVPHKVDRRLRDLRNFERSSGMVTSETGIRSISVTAGEGWRGLDKFTTLAKNTSGSGDTFIYWYRDGAGGWTQVSGSTQIDNVNYDDGSGVLHALNTNKYGVHWVFLCEDPQSHIDIVYGQGDYKLAEAQNAEVPSGLPDKIDNFDLIIAKIIIKKDAATFTEVATAFEIFFPRSEVINHNDLGNIDGGKVNEYYHLKNAEHDALVNGGSADAYHMHPNSGSVDTLDSVCERGATTDQPITVTSSGSVLKSLRVQNDLQIGGSLLPDVNDQTKFDAKKYYFNYRGSTGSFEDVSFYFRRKAVWNETIKYNASDNGLELGKGGGVVRINPEFVALYTEENKCLGHWRVYKDISVNFDYTSGDEDAIIWFNSTAQSLKWDYGNDRFEFSDNLYVNGDLEIAGDFLLDGVLAALELNSKSLVHINVDGSDENAQILFGDSGGKYCLQFAIADYAYASDHASLRFDTGDFSIEFWMWSSSSNEYLMSKNHYSNDGEWALKVDVTTGKVHFRAGAEMSTGLIGNTNVCDSQWHHVVVVKDGRDGYIYVDGKQDKQYANIFNADADFNAAVPFELGRWSGGNYFNGRIDELKLYKRALSPDDVNINYNLGYGRYGHIDEANLVAAWHMDENTGTACADYSTNSNTLTFGAGVAAPFWAAGKVCVAKILQWDKSSDRFEFDNNLYVSGNIEAAGSGSVFNSLRIDNDLHVYNNAIIDNDLYIGDGTTGANKNIFANNGDANLPALRYNETANRWEYSDDGVIFNSISGSGGGVEADTLDSVCERGAITDVAIIVTASGSVFKALRIQNDLQVGGDLEVDDNAVVDGTITVLSSGSVVKSLRVQNDLHVGNDLEVDDNAVVDGNIQALSSGSIFKSLRVQNDLKVGGDLDGDHNTLSNLQGGQANEKYHLKSAEHTGLTAGGSADDYHTHPSSGSGGGAGTKYILLPVDGATLPDDSAGNKTAAIERKKSSAGAPSPHFMQALFDDTTEEFLYWSFRFPGDYGSGLTAKIQYKMENALASSGSVYFDVALMCVSDGDAQDVDADAMGAVNSGNATVPGTVGYLDEISITLTNVDSLAAGDFVVIYLKRDADNASDTATGDCEVVAFSLEYTPS